MEYLRDRGTNLSAAKVHERVAAGFAALETFVDDVMQAEARVPAIPGEWTVQEVVDHLEFFTARAQAIIGDEEIA